MQPLVRSLLGAVIAAVPFVLAAPVAAQTVRVRDLVQDEAAVPVRLVGYGIVTGLDGTGDRGVGGGRQGGMTVQAVAQLLSRFNVQVPAGLLRTQNAAAVMVTAETSPYLRPGGRFEVQVSSVGDARSLRGGVLWMTPLITDAGADPVATAQGPLLLNTTGDGRRLGRGSGELTARIPAGGVLEMRLPTPATDDGATRLILRDPSPTTAVRIAQAIDGAFGPGTSRIEDPGAIRLAFKDTTESSVIRLARIGELTITPDRPARVIIDGRDGAVVAGSEIPVAAAVVSAGGVTLTVGQADTPQDTTTAGDVRVPVGATVQTVAAALHGMKARPAEIAAVFTSLREVGALSADVVIR